jgi:hypothetical protein
MSAASHHLKKLWYTNKANAQPSSPPPFHMPDDNELLSLVSAHISKKENLLFHPSSTQSLLLLSSVPQNECPDIMAGDRKMLM